MALMWFEKEKLEDTNEVMKCPNGQKKKRQKDKQ